jgi:hypothetical protein
MAYKLMKAPPRKKRQAVTIFISFTLISKSNN